MQGQNRRAACWWGASRAAAEKRRVRELSATPRCFSPGETESCRTAQGCFVTTATDSHPMDGIAAGRKEGWVLPFTSLDLVDLPFLGFDAGFGASSQGLGCRELGCRDSATSHNRNHILVRTVKAWGPFTEGISGPWDIEQERGHHEVWP